MALRCRLCLTENPKEKLENVFQCNLKHSNDSLVDVLFWVFSVEVDVTDPFTKDICEECVQLIECIMEAKSTFQKNQNKLRNHLRCKDNSNVVDGGVLNGSHDKNDTCGSLDRRESAQKKDSNTNDKYLYDCDKMLNSSLARNTCSDHQPLNSDLLIDVKPEENNKIIVTISKDISNTKEPPSKPEETSTTHTLYKTVSIGSQTETPLEKQNQYVLRVDSNSLIDFGPKVVLHPLRTILKEHKYKKIGQYSYTKVKEFNEDSDASEFGETSESDEYNEFEDDESDDAKRELDIKKKQRFLDYYKNFSSFAVRELIAGKKIRDNNEPPVFKISDVCNVFVCDFCSKTFPSQLILDSHYQKTHKTRKKFNSSCLKDEPNGVKPSIALLKRKFDCAEHLSNKKCFKIKNKSEVKCDPASEDGTDECRSEKLDKKSKLKRRLTSQLDVDWKRKGLGKYSAISYYKKYETNVSDAKQYAMDHKIDQKLDQTIQRLTNRLDSSANVS